MIEKMKHISNPLTVISIFAALAEIAGTVALATVDMQLQHLFIWFVMGFPVLLVILFFLTLNFNPRVLYAPSDFRDEHNFLEILLGSNRLSRNIDEIEGEISKLRKEVTEQIKDKVGFLNNREGNAIMQAFSERIDEVLKSVEATRKSAQQLSSDVAYDAFEQDSLPNSRLQSNIISFLANRDHYVSVTEISEAMKMSWQATQRALMRLISRGVLDGTLAAEELHVKLFKKPSG